MNEHPVEPFKIKMIEPINLITRPERELSLMKGKYNIFNLKSEEVFIDLLTDSGTSAMSDKQWSAMMDGDESYAGASSFERFEESVKDITGFEYVVPTHQGRAGENILCNLLIKPSQYIPSNMFFDTTQANVLASGGSPENLVIEDAYDPELEIPFKGNMDINKLHKFIKRVGPDKIPFGMVTITNNAGGGQPVSLENLTHISKTYHEFGIKFIIDACRFAENSYFIKMREPGFENTSIKEIAKRIFTLADGVIMSAKKDALVNIGGFIGLNDEDLYRNICNELIIREGFPTYGGLAGRDLEAVAVGLYEGLDERYLKYRIEQTRYLNDRLWDAGIPVIRPAGGHAVYVNAGKFLPHIPPEKFPGVSLASELYLEGGIRAVEIGSVVFGYENPVTGEQVSPRLELVRLAIPRRVYTRSHLDYIVGVFTRIKKNKDNLRGYRFTYAPKLLRHFTAEFEPI